MTCYKLVTVEFKWFGLQNRVENFIQRAERRLFTNFHRYKKKQKYFVWLFLDFLSEARCSPVIMSVQIFFSFPTCRQVFCWIDKWYGMTMEDIRALEDKVREELDKVSLNCLSW